MNVAAILAVVLLGMVGVFQDALALADSKRGLRIVEAIADRWGIDLTDNGKKVWVEFSKV